MFPYPNINKLKCPGSVQAMTEILVLYYSRNGATAAMARLIARGVESVPGASARILAID